MPQLTPLTEIEFLRGTSTNDECKPMFDAYEKCLSVSWQSLLKKEILCDLTFATESLIRKRH